MPKPSAQPARSTALDNLLEVFDSFSLKEKADFAIGRCATMANAIQEVYGPITDARAKPLQMLRGGEPHRQIICSLGGRRVTNGDVLELLIGVPEKWLPVWIDGLPKGLFACILTPYEVSRIELNERSFLRWPEKRPPALARFVSGLEAVAGREE